MPEPNFVQELAAAVTVPDFDACFREGDGGGASGDEPEELGDDGTQENAFGGEEGEDGDRVRGGCCTRLGERES